MDSLISLGLTKTQVLTLLERYPMLDWRKLEELVRKNYCYRCSNCRLSVEGGYGCHHCSRIFCEDCYDCLTELPSKEKTLCKNCT